MKLHDYLRFNQLFDLYGKLLTEKQQRIVSMHIRDDLSLFEIAEAEGITRQAVSDSIATARTKLEDYEIKLGVLAKVTETKAALLKLDNALTGSNEIAQAVNSIDDIWKHFDYKEE